MCYSCLSEINKEPEPVPGKKQQAGNKLRANPLFKAVMQELEAQRARGFSAHPKMERLKALILQHFGDGHAADDTRAIVFVTFREAVDEIVAELNREHPLIRASRFVGQANTKSGNKGFAQSEQLEVCQLLPIFLFMDGHEYVLYRSYRSSPKASSTSSCRQQSARKGLISDKWI